MKKIVIFSDGGARGNPGPAGVGAVLYDENKKIIATISQFLGVATNNQAEYQALILALEKASKLKAKEIVCYLDSELVVRQLNREYKVKNKDLAPLFLKIHNLSLQFNKISFFHIPREQNQVADKLANEAMDRGA